jgi:EAL domain-containing protein (putative c-di-GMP-specific phosphodiesterase class I)
MQGCLFGRPVEKEAMTERLAEKQAAVSRFEAAGVAV